VHHVGNGAHDFEQVSLVALLEHFFEFVADIEVIFNGLLAAPVMIRIWSQPEAMASSTPYWMIGLSTSGSISLGWALVAGRKRVPRPAAGNTGLCGLSWS